MPPANQGSNGPATIVTNVGANTFTLTDTDGNEIVSIPTTQSWLITLTDNSTTDGTWRALQMASTTSEATAAALAGRGLTAAGTVLNVSIGTEFVSANRTVVSGDGANLLVWQGGTGTLQLDLIANLGVGWWCGFSNQGTGVLTINCSGGQTINGEASFPLHPASSGAAQPGDTAFAVCGAGGFNTIGAPASPLSILNGGTGASGALQALVNLGGGSTGIAIFGAATAAAVLALLGITSNNPNGLYGATSVTTGGTAIVLTTAVPYTAYLNETLFAWLADATTTGATTVAANALAPVPIYRMDGTQVAAGDIKTGLWNEAVYLQSLNGGMGGFLLITSQNIETDIVYGRRIWCGLATGTANGITLTVPWTESAITAGDELWFQVATTNTGPTTIAPNTLPATTVMSPSPAGPVACSGYELVANNVAGVRYDGVEYQIISPRAGVSGYQLLFVLKAANLQNTGDQPMQAVAIPGTYEILDVTATNSNVNLAASPLTGGIYTAALKGGTVIVPATEQYQSLTSANILKHCDLSNGIGELTFTSALMFVSFSVAHNAPATADIRVWGRPCV